MLTDLVRKWTRWLLEPLASLINRTGISPNLLTVTGFVLMVGVAYVLATGHLQIGGVLIVVAGTFDALDGALARLAGRRSRFGAFLDSTVDRLSEAVIYLGLLVYYTQHGGRQESFLIYATIVGSLMVSYARARAEGIGVECKKGILTRFERVAVLVVGLILDQMLIALWILAILSNFTALQRMYHVWQDTGGEKGG
ncbi:MAG TPA: CDP-alcohol phosphatidyltransferase family protein [Anaerolineae bacterium]|nr:CDP-alcohol phosphatidyltransferase family protein [Anaerolineae bacterium]